MWPGGLLITRFEALAELFSELQFLVFNSLYRLFSLHSRLPRNACVCLADKATLHLPFSELLFPRVWAHDVGLAFLESHPDPEGVKRHRAQDYNSFQRR